MLLKRNLLESATIFSCAGTFICVVLNYVTNISPITGIWFPLYFITLFIAALFVSCKFIQWLLRLNKPIKYNLDGMLVDYPFLAFLSRVLPQAKKGSKLEWKEYDTNELSVISSVLERKLVSSWYMPYVSQEIGFPFACKQMLDQMLGKCFQICNKIETKDVYVDICTIFVSHLKEYKKALKRHEKSPSDTIESLYKKTHPIFNESNNKCIPADHCTNILRIVFKELVPWELWDTPHSELLVRILAKKLDSFIDNTLSDPVWLNDKLLTILKGKQPKSAPARKETMVLPEEKSPELISESTGTEPASLTKPTASVLQKNIIEDVQDVIQEKIEPILEEVPVTTSEPVDIKSSPVLRQRRGRQGRNEVKIYDRIIEGSIKTWETDLDLQCISVGQDLLASLDGEMSLGRLWGADAEPDGAPPHSKSPQPLWFGEEDTIDVDSIDCSPPRDSKKEQSPKSAELLKDLQSTVCQAKSRIGDLQVELVDPRRPASDEAAGMMEGLLDFGIAGLKKGLRFTGLSDDSQDKSPSHVPQKAGDKSLPLDIGRPRPAEHKDPPVSSIIQREDNSSIPPLLKQQRVISQDSLPSQAKSSKSERDFISPLVPLADSPEPEYEEAADLSSSIAKLRSLLQQRADASPRTEDVWWESAEETRGRTQHHHSSRPVDTATLADEYDMNMDRNSSPGQTNNMQRLDKLFQRTVTGVFNSIKTAVGAEGEEPAPRTLHDWTYVCTSTELSAGGAVGRLVGSRRAFTHVEAALDSLDQIPDHCTETGASPEDFEEWCSLYGSGCSAAGAALCAAGLAGTHVTHRLATLLLADLAESLIDVWLEDLSTWLRQQIFSTFEQMSERSDGSFTEPKIELAELNIDETRTAVMEKIPAGLLYVFGEDTVSTAVNLTLSSLGHRGVNRDVLFRALDILAVHFKKAAALRNPSFDNN